MARKALATAAKPTREKVLVRAQIPVVEGSCAKHTETPPLSYIRTRLYARVFSRDMV